MTGEKGSVSDAIGTFFEDRLRRSIPGLEDYRDCDNAPDFKWETRWIEAKGALDNIGYGIIPKGYQVNRDKKRENLVYACGYHDFKRAMQRLPQPTLRGKVNYIEWNARIAKLFFVSSSVIYGIWNAGFRHNKTLNQAYYRIPAYMFAEIANNKTIRRRDRVGPAREVYGLDELVCHPAESIGCVLTPADYEALAPMMASINPALFARRR